MFRSVSIRSALYTIHVVGKGLIGDTGAAGCRVVAGEIPIAEVFRAGDVEVLDRLINDLYVGEYLLRAYDLGYLGRDLVVGVQIV